MRWRSEVWAQGTTGGTRIVRHRREPSVWRLIAGAAARAPDAAAIGAPGRSSLSYSGLIRLIAEVQDRLNALGIGRGDRVALLAPNGPELAVACIAIASCATCIPLNPSLRAAEFETYLQAVKANVLVAHAETDSPAPAVAARLGLAVLSLVPEREAYAGVLTLTGEARAASLAGGVGADGVGADGFAGGGDVALLLPTSGTTARPKLVPLTHANVCASAVAIAASLALTPDDRSLNILPLFHIHGLMACLLAPLSAGATVVCTPGFDPGQFLLWMDEFNPSWYTAVPTMHQAILAAGARAAGALRQSRLRFIRSCSAPLPPRTAAELERVFAAPVIEAYGMTEAAHQIASNPLPPARRKAGSVGVPTGCTVAVMDGAGRLLRRGESGELVVRGPNVTSGYADDPAANAAAFRDGWFRTGDQGFVDGDGYVFITGRLKELINRAGAKISPYEVERALLEHPAVVQAVVFGVPHASLGEDVAAAVVLREPGAATEADLREYAATRLADQKVPAQVLVLDDLPKGPIGKLQRGRLAEQLGPLLRPSFAAPRDEVEETLARIWAEVLGLERIGVYDNFFERGGDSLAAVIMLTQVAETFGKHLPLTTLLRATTIVQLADVVRCEGRATPMPSLVSIQPNGSRPPFYCVHGVGGNVLNFRDLAHHLGPDQPFYALQAQGVDGNREPYERIEDMAAHYVNEIRDLQAHGPYYLGGHSFGGLIAYEMAQQLHAQGEQVALLALIDTYLSEDLGFSWISRTVGPAVRFQARRARHHLSVIRRLGYHQRLAYLAEKGEVLSQRVRERFARSAYRLFPALKPPRRAVDDPLPAVLRKVEHAHRRAADRYVPRPYAGRIVLLVADTPVLKLAPPEQGWSALAAGGLSVVRVPGGHATILQEPAVAALAGAIRARFDEALPASGRQRT